MPRRAGLPAGTPVACRGVPAASLQDLVDELATGVGLRIAATRNARVYRDPVGGTVAWVPHDGSRLELTLIQVRLADEPLADRLHAVLAECAGLLPDDIPSHLLGLDGAAAAAAWPQLVERFWPAYLDAHRAAQRENRRTQPGT